MPKTAIVNQEQTGMDALTAYLVEQVKAFLPNRSTKVRTLTGLPMQLDETDPADKANLDLFARFETKIEAGNKALASAKAGSVEFKTLTDEVASLKIGLGKARRLVFGLDDNGTVQPESFLDALHKAVQAVNASEWINGDMIQVIKPDATAWTYGLQRMKRRAKQDRDSKPVSVNTQLADLAKLVADKPAAPAPANK